MARSLIALGSAALGVAVGAALVGVRRLRRPRTAPSEPLPVETSARVSVDLHHAAQTDDLEALGWILDAAPPVAIVDARGNANETALHRACGAGHIDAARRLLAAGADPSARAKEGETPLHLATLDGNEALVQLLIDAGAQVNIATETGLMPLHLAALQGHAAIVRALVAAGASVHAIDAGDNQPLHRAAAQGHLDVVELLLEAGADPTQRGYNGMTAESLAVLHRHPHVVARLRPLTKDREPNG